MIKLRWIACIWHQNEQKCRVRSQTTQNNAKLQKWSNTLICIDLASKQSKQRKTTKVIKLQWIASIWCKKHQSNTKLQKHRFDQLRMNCIDLTSKWSKMLSYVAKHSKQRKTTKAIKIQWLASIWCRNYQSNAKLQTRSNYDEFASIWRPNDRKCWVTSQNIQNNAKLHKWSKYNDLHRFDVKNIKTTQNYKNYQITWIASIWCPND